MRTPVYSVGLVGVLSDLSVDDGDQVAAGQQICAVECMKVFNYVVAPVAGTVHFEAELGQVLSEDEVVAWIDS